jgi:hypothetical protein
VSKYLLWKWYIYATVNTYSAIHSGEKSNLDLSLHLQPQKHRLKIIMACRLFEMLMLSPSEPSTTFTRETLAKFPLLENMQNVYWIFFVNPHHVVSLSTYTALMALHCTHSLPSCLRIDFHKTKRTRPQAVFLSLNKIGFRWIFFAILFEQRRNTLFSKSKQKSCLNIKYSWSWMERE